MKIKDISKSLTHALILVDSDVPIILPLWHYTAQSRMLQFRQEDQVALNQLMRVLVNIDLPNYAPT